MYMPPSFGRPTRGVAQSGSASASGAEGRRFKSSRPDDKRTKFYFVRFFFTQKMVHMRRMQLAHVYRIGTFWPNIANCGF